MTTNHAQAERHALCDLFDELGPSAPTLCEGWTTRDMAAHLVVRERRPDAAIGILAAPFADHGERVRRSFAERPYAELVQLVRSGPPLYSVMHPGFVDKAVNTLEYFVHHEDVRRAADDWEPRDLEPDLDDQLWTILARMAKILVRKSPIGIALASAGRDSIVAKKVEASEPTVEIRGSVGDLVMFVEGRQRASGADLHGPAAAVAALRSAKFGV